MNFGVYQPHQAIGFAHGGGEAMYPDLWKGFVCNFSPCLGYAGRDMADISPGRYPWAIVGTAWNITDSPIGKAFSFSGNAAFQQVTRTPAFTLPCKIGTGSDNDVLVISAYFKFTHSAGAKQSTIFWSDNPTAGSPNFYGYRLYVDNNADTLVLMIANNDDNAVTLPNYYTSAAITPGKWIHAIVIWDRWWTTAGQACAMWIDGQKEFPTVTLNEVAAEQTMTHSVLNSRIGATLGSIAPDFSVALVNVWNRQVDEIGIEVPAMIRELSPDPLRPFRHVRWG